MATTKRKVRYTSPIGTFNHPWLDTPCKFDRNLGDNGRSAPAEPTDVQAEYSVNLVIDKKVFEASDFKKQVDEVWKLAQEEFGDSFDATNPPYSVDEEGDYKIIPRTKAAFLKDGKPQRMQPALLDCDGKNVTDFIVNEGIKVGSGSLGRVIVTTYTPKPYKSDRGKHAGKRVLSMKLDLKVAQFKRLDRYEGNSGDGAEAIDDGVPVAEDYGEALPI